MFNRAASPYHTVTAASLAAGGNLQPLGWTVARAGILTQDVGSTTHLTAGLSIKRYLVREDYDRLSGRKLCERAVAMKGNRSLEDGQFLLHQEEWLRKELAISNHVVLPGTILRSQASMLYVGILTLQAGVPTINFTLLEATWTADGRFCCDE